MARERDDREREGGSEAVALEAWLACCSHALSWFFSLLLHFTCCSRLSLSLEMEIANWKIPSIYVGRHMEKQLLGCFPACHSLAHLCACAAGKQLKS